MNPARIDYVHDRLDALTPDHSQALDTMNGRGAAFWLKGRKVLDVGCGGGILSESLRRLGADVTGLDASGEGIAVAREHAREHGLLTTLDNNHDPTQESAAEVDRPGSLAYRHATVEEHARSHAGSYDLIFAMEILEHVNNPARFLRTCASMLKPPRPASDGARDGASTVEQSESGGLLFVSTIEKSPLAHLLTITVAEQLLRLVPRGTHDSAKFIPKAALARWCNEMGQSAVDPTTQSTGVLRQQGLAVELVDTRGCIFDPIADRWRIMPARTPWAEMCNYFATIERVA